MTRETRINLIFAAVLVAVMTPGAVILFRKKMEPAARPMYLPDPVSGSIAYLSPLEVPPGKRRVVPPRTGEWVEAIVKERIGGDLAKVTRPVDVEGLPLVSAEKAFQVVAVERVGADLRVWAIDWTGREDASEKWHVAGAESVEMTESAIVPVPEIVREELGTLNLLKPPHTVSWQVLRVVQPAEKSLTLRKGPVDFVNLVKGFTSPVSTVN